MKILPVLSLAVVLAGCTQSLGPEANIRRLGLATPTGERLTLCHGFECRYRTNIAFSANDLRHLRRIMARTASPAAERERVAKAVAWFEQKAGKKAGTAGDMGGLNFESGARGQQDCIDESTTTTNFLVLMQKNGLLSHHKVGGTVARGFLLDGRYPHATATLIESKSEQAWAIDSWVRDNGEEPVVMRLERWMAQRPGETG